MNLIRSLAFKNYFVTGVLFLAGLFSSAEASQSSWAQGKSKAAEVRLLSQLASLSPSSYELLLGLEFRLQPGWHIYWKNAGDVGYAPKLQWQLPSTWQAAALLYPSPKEFPAAEAVELISYGYETHAIYLNYLQGREVSGAEFPIDLKLEYLVCKEQCIPEAAHLKLNLPINSTEKLSAHERLLAEAFEKVPAESAAFKAEWKNEKELVLEFLTHEPDFLAFYSENQKGKFWNTKKISNTKFEFEFKKEVSEELDFVAPGKSLSISGKIAEPETVLSAALLGTLLIAFIGGLILNLMPCVLPVLLLKTNHLFQLRNKKRGYRSSLVYTILGILVSFVALGLITNILRETGEQIGWGFQFQSPYFLMFLSFVLFIFSLNLFDVFDFQLPFSWTNKIGSQSGAFFEGVFATLLATPCSAPFLGTALSYALTQGSLVSFATFLSMGLGLAFPYFIFMAFPKLLKLLPKPGAWMFGLKRFLGYSILIVILWTLYLFLRQTNALLLSTLMLSLLFIFIAVKELKGIWKWLGVLIVAAGSILLFQLPSLRPSEENYSEYNLQMFEEEALQDKPLFLYITADWCFTCKFNEASVIRTPGFEAFMKEKGIEIRRIDWTSRDESVSRFLDKYGRVGIPFAMISWKGRFYLFPELMTRGSTEKAIINFISSPTKHQPLR